MTTLPAGQELEESRYEPDVTDEAEEEDSSYRIDQYDILSAPNDFNTQTIVNFIESGVVVIPGFQRNYVWDGNRASRLIESIIVGLPVPQVFLYEQERNKYLVIDGQQRLMSIYYFVKERFPRRDKRADLRLIAEGRSSVHPDVLANDEYFTDFRLRLPANVPGNQNRFHGRQYSTLDESDRTSFDLRTIRNIIVRQVHPAGDEAMFEIFNRLNSGGVNLTPQEIRRCMFDSKFYDMLYETNTDDKWRKLVGARIPDIHMKDVEILLRGFAMLIKGEEYRPSMVKFLNRFSQNARAFTPDYLQRLRELLQSFLSSCQGLPGDAFHSTPGRFSPMIFESVFVAACQSPFAEGKALEGKIDLASLKALKEDGAFTNAARSKTTDTVNVKTRLERASEILVLA